MAGGQRLIALLPDMGSRFSVVAQTAQPCAEEVKQNPEQTCVNGFLGHSGFWVQPPSLFSLVRD